MVQDKLGYMWMATKKGLYRYNGYEMVNYSYNPLDQNSIPSDVLEAVAVDSSGNIWLGSLGAGVFRFDPIRQRFTQFRHDDDRPGSLSADWVSALLADSKGNIWVGTGNGLDRFDSRSGEFIHYTAKEDDDLTLSSNEVISIYEDKKGTIWVGTGSVYSQNKKDPEFGGLNRMDDISGRFTRFKHSSTDTNTLINNKVRALFESSDGTFWVGTAGDGLHTLDRETGKIHRRRHDPKHPEALSRTATTGDEFGMITFITEDAKGKIWIGTSDNGFTYYDPQTKIAYQHPGPVQEGTFGNDSPWAAFTSAEGMFWMSTVGGNLYTYNVAQERVPYVEVNSEVNGFYEEKDGTLWVSSEGGLLHYNRWNNLISKYTHDPTDPSSLRTNRILTLTPDSKGDLWLGTLGYGLERFSTKTGRVTHFSRNPEQANSLGNDTVLRVYEDRQGNMWAGTFYGFSIIDVKNGKISRHIVYPTDTTSFGRNIVTATLIDKSDNCWIGSFVGGGLHLFDRKSGQFKTYLNGVSIADIVEDSDGKLWAGGVEGLFLYDKGLDSFMRFNDPAGLRQIVNVKSIIEDDNKNLWMVTEGSLVVLNAKRDVVTMYDQHLGIDKELTYGLSYKDKSGKLYFSAASGYYSIDPRTFNTQSKPPQIVLSNFRLSNQLILPGESNILLQDIALTNKITLRHNQNIFSIDFASVDFVDPNANRHLFMLQNYDRSWNVPGFDRRATYFNVPPGIYVFRVRAVNAYGKWSERSVTIEIIPAWWSRWWFHLAVLIALVAGIYFLIKWRLNEKFRLQMERSEKEKELSRLQHRTSQLEMHALRAQMNPHFLFNSLNSINRFILQNNSEQASGYLTKFSRLMRLILQNSQHEMIPLENELEALKLYLELEAVRFDHHFSYVIRVDEDLDMLALKVPPLIIQPYAENAIWHGLMHKEEKGNLVIELKEEAGYLVCSITDDGIGRKKAAELKSKSASTHKSMGMKITADRIASMRQRKSNENNIQITDLVMPDGTPGGTRVEIKIALQYD